MTTINLRSAMIKADHITVITELEKWHPCIAMRLEVVARDAHGHYAVKWDIGDRWMAGEFVDVEDDPQLYAISDEDREFIGEEGEAWRTVKQSDGGFKWVSELATPACEWQDLDLDEIPEIAFQLVQTRKPIEVRLRACVVSQVAADDWSNEQLVGFRLDLEGEYGTGVVYFVDANGREWLYCQVYRQPIAAQ